MFGLLRPSETEPRIAVQVVALHMSKRHAMPSPVSLPYLFAAIGGDHALCQKSLRL